MNNVALEYNLKRTGQKDMLMKNRANLKDKVYTMVKSRILTFELKPGEKILENEVARDLGVSRTPVREALNKLEQEGLIKALSNKGYSVSDVTGKEIEELYEIREALEVLAIRAAAKKSRPEDWADLEQVILNQDSGNDRDSEERKDELFKDAHKFHEELVRISGNETLQQMLNTICEKINRLQWMNVFFVDRARSSHSEHLKIVKLLKRGEIEKALAANQKHIRHSKESILKFFNRKKNLLYIG